MSKLEVGDRVYSYERFGSRLRRYVISRVTPKTAFVATSSRSEIKLKRKIPDGGCWFVGTEYGLSPIYVENDDLLEEYNHRQAIDRVKLIKVEELTMGQLRQIIEIVRQQPK